ncbi:MAG: hypothetical protein ACREIA_12920 [Opitutaceae bacterium]
MQSDPPHHPERSPEPAIRTNLAASCVACREQIHPGAYICPHCGSAQKPSRWKLTATALKWIGGATAVISLVMGMRQVHGLYSDWMERRETVADLIGASRLQRASGDFGGAWSTIEDALRLEPGSPRVRDEMAAVAMEWLREARATEGRESFSDIVTRVTPTLYAGLGRRSAQEAADLRAHIGWASFLRFREGVRGLAIEEHYQEALALDLENPFAHAMLAHWRLWTQPGTHEDGRSSLDIARQHFARALSNGRETAFVRHMQLSALANHEQTDPQARMEMVRVAIEMHRENNLLRAPDAARVLRVFIDAFAPTDPTRQEMRDQLLNEFPPRDLYAVFCVLDELRSEPDLRNLYIRALLLEHCDSPAEALAILHTIRESLQSRTFTGLEPQVTAAIIRLESTAAAKPTAVP